jgi:hypothetical protein
MYSWAGITPRKEKKEGRKQNLLDKREKICQQSHNGLDDRHCVFRLKCQLKVQNKKCGLTLATKISFWVS